MTYKPTCAVTGNIKLGHHTDTAVSRVRDNFAHLVLRVIQTIGAHRMEFWKLLALDAKALVLRQVPVKNVELDRGHRIEIAFKNLNRLEVTGNVDKQTAPGKARADPECLPRENSIHHDWS